MKFFSIALAVSLIGSFASAMTIPEARRANALIAAKTDKLVGTCDAIKSDAAKIRFEITSIEAGLNEFAVGPDRSIESAIKNLDLAIDAVDMSLIECVNYQSYGSSSSNSKVLLDMYLVHVDIELMIAQYGVGPDLKRAR